ncbi:MAG: right-handed parallel beta-helix repeat-containing protein [Anaerolineales bacterium]
MAGTVSLTDTTITANTMGAVLSGTSTPSCAGASYIDNQNNVSIQKVNVSNNKKGGIAICNAASASIVDAYVHQNTVFGVLISSTPGFSLLNVRVGETRAWKGKFGDGLIVTHSSGLVKDSQFSANKRANIIYYGKSGGTLDNNLIIYAMFSIVLDGKDGSSPNPIIKNNNYMYGNRENRVTFGSNLASTPPPKLPTL